MLIYFNGRFVNEDKAVVSVNNRSFRYGDGCFETMKLQKGKVLLPQFHADRLFASLKTLQFEWPSFFNAEYLISQAEELARRNLHQELARVRLTIFSGDGGLYDLVKRPVNWLIQTWPLNAESNRLNENGLVIDVFEGGFKACDKLSNLKSNNFLLYALAALEAKQKHCNDVLVLNQHGRIADTTIANVWIAEQNLLITPPLSEAPIAGTMRRHLLQHAGQFGLAVKEEPITLERMRSADELWLSNAIYGIKWVKHFGEKVYGNAIAAQLHRQLLEPMWQ